MNAGDRVDDHLGLREPDRPEIVVMDGISKRFGSVRALDGAHFQARSGEVHALLGENGAGKTTIMNVLCGLYQPDDGRISIRGRNVAISTPKDAVKHRIGMVHQHFELVDVFSAFDNIVLGAEQSWYSSQESTHRRDITELAAQYGMEVELDRPVRELSAGEQQKVEILRTLYGGLDVLVLDEPTTHLTPLEVERLFKAIRELVRGGLAVVFISHKLREVLAVADRITVLRKGKTVGTIDSPGADEATIVSMLMGAGRSLKTVDRSRHAPGGRSALELRSVRGQDADASESLSLHLLGGEILGIAGVAGNGQKRLVDLISGVIRSGAGQILLEGEDITRYSVARRIQMGLSVLPEDRLREGILPNAPLYETYYLGLHHHKDHTRWDRQHIRDVTKEAIAAYNVVAPSEYAPSAVLSGGNIQKVLVARALAMVAGSEGVIVAMNPTHGLDIASAAFVHQKLLDFSSEGGGVLLISEDLDELMFLCDRIMVLRAEQLVSEHQREEFDRYAIGANMVGAHDG